MAKLDDFELDVQIKTSVSKIEPQITSKSLCTPGCITGVLMCFTKGCEISHSCVKC